MENNTSGAPQPLDAATQTSQGSLPAGPDNRHGNDAEHQPVKERLPDATFASGARPATAHRLTALIWLIGGVLIVAAMIWLIYIEFMPGPGQVIIEWTTASEVNTAGFNLYRAEQPDGNYQKANVELIPSAVDPMLGGQYAYTDTGVVSGQTYYYHLEDVEYSGSTVRHGPLEARAQPASSPVSSVWWWGALISGGGLSLIGFWIDRRRGA